MTPGIFYKFIVAFALFVVSTNLEAGNEPGFLTAPEKEWLQKNNNLVIGISQDWAPYEYLDSAGNYRGITAEYFKLIAEKIGIRFTVSARTSWDSVLSDFRNHQIHLLPAVFISPGRSVYTNFSEPYMEVEFVVACRDKEKFKNFNDLKGKKVGCLKAWVVEDDLRKDNKELQIEVYDNSEQLFAALLFNHIDAMVADIASLTYYFQRHNLYNINIAFKTRYKYKLAIGIAKENTLLASAVKKAMDHTPRGIFEVVSNKWMDVRFLEKEKEIRFIRTILWIGLAVLIFGIGWIVILRNAVRIKTRSLLQQLKINQLNSEIAIANEKKYRILFENSSNAIFILKGSVIADCNLTASKLCQNNNPVDLKGSCIKSVFNNSYPNSPLGENLWLELLELGSFNQCEKWHEMELMDQNGQTLFFELSTSRFISGNEDTLVLFIRDISNRKKNEIKIKTYQESLVQLVREKTEEYLAINEELSATLEELQNEVVRKTRIEQELFQKQETLNGFITQSDEGISILDKDGRILEWNKKLEEILGITKKEVLGQYIWDVEYLYQLPERRTEALYLELKSYAEGYLNGLDQKKPFKLERFVVGKTGNEVFLITTVFPVVTPYGSIVGRISTDITRIKNIEIELNQYKDKLEDLVRQKTLEIKKLSQQYLDLFQNTSDGILFYVIENNKVTFLQMNQSAKRMIGLIEDEGEKPTNLVLNQIQDAIVANIRGNDYFKIQLKTHSKPLGKYLEISNTPVSKNQEGMFQYAMFVRDISQKARADKEMEFTDKIFNVAQNLILVTDKNGTILKYNQSFLEASMLPANKLHFAIYWDLLPLPGDKINIQRVYNKVMGGEYPCEYECTWILPNGEQKYILWKNTLINNYDGSDVFILSSGIDLTERKLIEKSLTESEEKFRSIFNASNDGIAILDPDLRFLLVNNAILNASGYWFEELARNSFKDFISDCDGLKVCKALRESEPGKTILFENIWLSRKGKEPLPVEITAKHSKIAGQQGYLLIMHDISERLMHEQKLMSAIIETEERERRRFSGDLHDEAGPLLASMRIYLSTLAQKIELYGQNAIIEKVMNLLKETTDSIRRISNNISPLVLENYGLEAAIKNEFETKTEFIKIDLESEIGNQRFDPNMELSIFRIVKELLNNTLKYANATDAFLSMKLMENVLQINYSDNGKGFDLEALMKSKHKGLGLLNILNRVKTMKGQCEMHSNPGEGFHFFMKISIKV